MARKSDIRIRRSAVAGAVPSVSDLNLGELALNTYDGKLYAKKSVAGTDSIVELSGGGAAQNTIWTEFIYSISTSTSTISGSDDNGNTLAYLTGALQVFVNGVLQDPNTDYSATSGTTITLTNAVSSGDHVQVAAFSKLFAAGDMAHNNFSGNGSTTAFTLGANPGDENNTLVFIDGVYQNKDTYSVSGTTLTFSTAPANGTSIDVSIGTRNVSLGNVADLTLGGNLSVSGSATLSGLSAQNSESTALVINGSSVVGTRELGAAAFAATSDNIVEGSTNLFYNNERVDDRVNALLQAGTGITLTYNDAANTLTIAGAAQYGDSDVESYLDTNGTTFPDNVKAQFGGSNDLQIYHDASDSYIEDAGTGSLLIKSNGLGIKLQSAWSGVLYDVIDVLGFQTDIKSFGTTRLSVKNTGIDVTGEVKGDSLDIDGNADISGNLILGGNLTVNGTTTTLNTTTLDVEDKNITLNYHASNDTSSSADGSGITIQDAVNATTDATMLWDATHDKFTFSHPINPTNILINDNNKIRFGDSQDLEIFHDGNNSFVKDNGDGNLNIVTNGNGIDLRSTTHGTIAFLSHSTGGVNLKHGGSTKLETTSTGVDVTGTLTATTLAGTLSTASQPNITSLGTLTTLTVDNVNINGDTILLTGSTASGFIQTSSNVFQIGTSTNDRLDFFTNNTVKATLLGGGNFGLGTTSPLQTLHVATGHTLFERGVELRSKDTGGSERTIARVDGSNRLQYGWSGNGGVLFMGGGSYTERMRIHTNGNIGINYTTPPHALSVKGTISRLNTSGIQVINLQTNSDAGQIAINNSGGTQRVLLSSAGGSGFTGGNLGIGTFSPAVSLDAGSNTDAIRLPNGTTGERPSAAAGQLRYNTTLSEFEGYDGSSWGKIGGGNAFGTIAVSGQSNLVADQELDTLTLVGQNGVTITTNAGSDTVTIDGHTSFSPFNTDLFTTTNASTTAFVLTTTPSTEDNLIVFVEGVYQNKNSYTLSGSTVTLDSAPLSGAEVVIHTIGDGITGVGLNRDNFTGNGSTTAFTLSFDPLHENNTFVYFDGVYQEKSEYSVSGTTLTFSTAPANGDSIEVIMPQATEIQTPSTNSINAASQFNQSNIVPQAITTTTVATTNATTIASHSATTYRTIKYLVQCTQGTDYHSTEINLIHDGTTVYITEYGTLFDNAALGTFDASISSGNILLQITAGSASSMTVKVLSSAITL